jgi:tetratricopeptide (TPR) repeat protein
MKHARVWSSGWLIAAALGSGVALAGFVSGVGSASAELAPPRRPNAEPGTPQSRELSSQAAEAEVRGNSRQALQLADQALAADARNPWAFYDRATAMARLGQTDQAVASFWAAEQRFPADDRWARSVSIYGRAHALDGAHRCVEAKAAFAEYAAFVQKDDPGSAAMALRYASECHTAPEAPPAPPAPAVK